METFLLGVGDRLLQVGVQDERGSAGAVLTLADKASHVSLLPVRPRTPTQPTTTEEPFHTLPQGLSSEHLGRVDRLVLDTSELPGELLVFSIEPFVEQVARYVQGPEAMLRLTMDDAEAWGLIEPSGR